MSPKRLTMRCSEPRPAPMRSFDVVSSSSLQSRALSGAVADLVSRQMLLEFGSPLGPGDKRYYDVARSRSSRAQPQESVKPEPPWP
jgi:hypothetical protein